MTTSDIAQVILGLWDITKTHAQSFVIALTICAMAFSVTTDITSTAASAAVSGGSPGLKVPDIGYFFCDGTTLEYNNEPRLDYSPHDDRTIAGFIENLKKWAKSGKTVKRAMTLKFVTMRAHQYASSLATILMNHYGTQLKDGPIISATASGNRLIVTCMPFNAERARTAVFAVGTTGGHTFVSEGTEESPAWKDFEKADMFKTGKGEEIFKPDTVAYGTGPVNGNIPADSNIRVIDAPIANIVTHASGWVTAHTKDGTLCGVGAMADDDTRLKRLAYSLAGFARVIPVVTNSGPVTLFVHGEMASRIGIQLATEPSVTPQEFGYRVGFAMYAKAATIKEYVRLAVSKFSKALGNHNYMTIMQSRSLKSTHTRFICLRASGTHVEVVEPTVMSGVATFGSFRAASVLKKGKCWYTGIDRKAATHAEGTIIEVGEDMYVVFPVTQGVAEEDEMTVHVQQPVGICDMPSPARLTTQVIIGKDLWRAAGMGFPAAMWSNGKLSGVPEGKADAKYEELRLTISANGVSHSLVGSFGTELHETDTFHVHAETKDDAYAGMRNVLEALGIAIRVDGAVFNLPPLLVTMHDSVGADGDFGINVVEASQPVADINGMLPLNWAKPGSEVSVMPRAFAARCGGVCEGSQVMCILNGRFPKGIVDVTRNLVSGGLPTFMSFNPAERLESERPGILVDAAERVKGAYVQRAYRLGGYERAFSAARAAKLHVPVKAMMEPLAKPIGKHDFECQTEPEKAIHERIIATDRSFRQDATGDLVDCTQMTAVVDGAKVFCLPWAVREAASSAGKVLVVPLIANIPGTVVCTSDSSFKNAIEPPSHADWQSEDFSFWRYCKERRVEKDTQRFEAAPAQPAPRPERPKSEKPKLPVLVQIDDAKGDKKAGREASRSKRMAAPAMSTGKKQLRIRMTTEQGSYINQHQRVPRDELLCFDGAPGEYTISVWSASKQIHYSPLDIMPTGVSKFSLSTLPQGSVTIVIEDDEYQWRSEPFYIVAKGDAKAILKKTVSGDTASLTVSGKPGARVTFDDDIGAVERTTASPHTTWVVPPHVASAELVDADGSFERVHFGAEDMRPKPDPMQAERIADLERQLREAQRKIAQHEAHIERLAEGADHILVYSSSVEFDTVALNVEGHAFRARVIGSNPPTFVTIVKTSEREFKDISAAAAVVEEDTWPGLFRIQRASTAQMVVNRADATATTTVRLELPQLSTYDWFSVASRSLSFQICPLPYGRTRASVGGVGVGLRIGGDMPPLWLRRHCCGDVIVLADGKVTSQARVPEGAPTLRIGIPHPEQKKVSIDVRNGTLIPRESCIRPDDAAEGCSHAKPHALIPASGPIRFKVGGKEVCVDPGRGVTSGEYPDADGTSLISVVICAKNAVIAVIDGRAVVMTQDMAANAGDAKFRDERFEIYVDFALPPAYDVATALDVRQETVIPFIKRSKGGKAHPTPNPMPHQDIRVVHAQLDTLRRKTTMTHDQLHEHVVQAASATRFDAAYRMPAALSIPVVAKRASEGEAPLSVACEALADPVVGVSTEAIEVSATAREIEPYSRPASPRNPFESVKAASPEPRKDQSDASGEVLVDDPLPVAAQPRDESSDDEEERPATRRRGRSGPALKSASGVSDKDLRDVIKIVHTKNISGDARKALNILTTKLDEGRILRSQFQAIGKVLFQWTTKPKEANPTTLLMLIPQDVKVASLPEVAPQREQPAASHKPGEKWEARLVAEGRYGDGTLDSFL